MKVKLVLKIDKDYLNELTKNAAEAFKKLEAEQLRAVDLNLCLIDYIEAAFICHNVTYIDAKL